MFSRSKVQGNRNKGALQPQRFAFLFTSVCTFLPDLWLSLGQLGFVCALESEYTPNSKKIHARDFSYVLTWSSKLLLLNPLAPAERCIGLFVVLLSHYGKVETCQI